MNPALAAARQRAQAAIELDYGSTVTIGGTDYACAVMLDALQPVMNDQGLWENRQVIHISILKTLLVTPPGKRAELIHAGITYKVDEEVGGYNAVDVAWQLTAHRKMPSPA
jgi:hypothetical protein